MAGGGGGAQRKETRGRPGGPVQRWDVRRPPELGWCWSGAGSWDTWRVCRTHPSRGPRVAPLTTPSWCWEGAETGLGVALRALGLMSPGLPWAMALRWAHALHPQDPHGAMFPGPGSGPQLPRKLTESTQAAGGRGGTPTLDPPEGLTSAPPNPTLRAKATAPEGVATCGGLGLRLHFSLAAPMPRGLG